jgi:DNA-binding NtrC family response regulator
MILGDGEWICPSDLPARGEGEPACPNDNLSAALDLFEKNHIERTLNKAGGDKGRAAELMGLSLSTLYRKLEKLAIES